MANSLAIQLTNSILSHENTSGDISYEKLAPRVGLEPTT